MLILRSENGDLHRDGQPAIKSKNLTQYWVDNRLHRSNGPAVITPNGKMYFWRGLNISRVMWHECEKYNYKDVMEIRNIELRRAIIEKVGFGKFIKDAKRIDKGEGDFEGCALYKIRDDTEQKPDDIIKFVELKNSSPEPDGSYNMYYLRVPPQIKSLVEAIKWSFGYEKDAAFKYIKQT